MNKELTRSELEAETALELPDREAMSLVNANLALPINLALAANVLSDGATAVVFSAFSAGNTDVTYVTIFQRVFTGKDAHEGIPFALLPRVTNQKISPGGTDSSFPSTSDGTLPVPFPALPWHDRQYFPYSDFPACAAASLPS